MTSLAKTCSIAGNISPLNTERSTEESCKQLVSGKCLKCKNICAKVGEIQEISDRIASTNRECTESMASTFKPELLPKSGIQRKSKVEEKCCENSIIGKISEVDRAEAIGNNIIRLTSSTDSKRQELLNQLQEGQYDIFDSTTSSDDSYCSQTVCDNYLDIRTFAAVFVDEIINDSITIIDQVQNELNIDDDMKLNFVSENYKDLYTDIIQWPSIAEFSVELGFKKLQQCINLWKLKENWKYSINCLGIESDDTNDYYKYEAIFSLPNKQYPIAQAIARIFYTIEASKIKPKQCKVDVSFNYEGSRLVHHSRNCEIHEAWLFYIIDSKLKFFKTLKF